MNEVLMKSLPFWIAAIAVFAVVIGVILAIGLKIRKKQEEKGFLLVYLSFVLFLSFFTRFLGFNYPFNTFWDENYHVASAQKYIDHVMFMEPHPPLGKMLIALGEMIVNPNSGIDTSGFLTTDYIRDFPAGYSFLGVRFIPTLLSTLSAVLFFLILFVMSRNPHYSFLFSFFYLFENSMIVHTRSAMLEGPQLFFILAALLYFIWLYLRTAKTKLRDYFLLGLAIGLAVSVKVNSLILVLVYPVLVWKDHKDELLAMDWKSLLTGWKNLLVRSGKFLKVLSVKTLLAVAGIFVTVSFFYYIHCAVGDKVLQDRKYQASKDYELVLRNYQTANPFNFPLMLADNLKFISHYEKGVPLWDPTKSDENGSPAFTWPVGYKSINYRWEKSMGKTSYFYYQGNPLIWFISLFAAIAALGLVLAKAMFGFEIRDKGKLNLMALFTFLYFAYIIVMSNIQRVMYLYHYLIPLVFAMIVVYLLFLLLFENLVRSNDKLLYYTVVLIALELFVAYLFFSPLTYGIPLSASDFAKRAWLRIWFLKYIMF